jgi:hypothetical protein
MRSPDDTPLRDGNRDRLMGLLTARCVPNFAGAGTVLTIDQAQFAAWLAGTAPVVCCLLKNLTQTNNSRPSN